MTNETSIGRLLPPTGSYETYGLFGDYVGGVWGTLFSAVTLIFVFLTWKTTRKTSHFEVILSLLAEMLATHDLIVTSNPDLAAKVHSDFSVAYRATRQVESDDNIWLVDDRIDIAYTYTFFGINTNAMHSLKMYGEAKIQRVHDILNEIRVKAYQNDGQVLKGYQPSLSQYMRNLFGMYDLIDTSRLSFTEKKQLGKVVRTKLSNYDQAMIFLNIISHLGQEWENRGFVERYKPFANIPKHFFGIDNMIDLKERFPTVAFEWEDHRGKAPYYHQWKILRLKLVWYFKAK